MNHTSSTKAAPPHRALLTPGTWAVILTIMYLLLAMCGRIHARELPPAGALHVKA